MGHFLAGVRSIAEAGYMAGHMRKRRNLYTINGTGSFGINWQGNSTR